MHTAPKRPPCRCERYAFPHRADHKCAAMAQAREDELMTWSEWADYAHKNNFPLFGYSEP